MMIMDDFKTGNSLSFLFQKFAKVGGIFYNEEQTAKDRESTNLLQIYEYKNMKCN